MFDIFDKNCLTCINTTADADTIKAFKRSYKIKEAFDCLFKSNNNNTLKQSRKKHEKKRILQEWIQLLLWLFVKLY